MTIDDVLEEISRPYASTAQAVLEDDADAFERAQRWFDEVVAENFAGEYVAERSEAMRV